MSKYSEELVNRIVNLIEEDTYTVTEICRMVGITRKSFYEWKEAKPAFKEAIASAQEYCNEKLLAIARRSLKRKIEGYTLTDVRTIYVPDENEPSGWKLKSKIVREKEYAPDHKAIQIVLEKKQTREGISHDSERSINITVSDGKAAELIGILEGRLQDEVKVNACKTLRKEMLEEPEIAKAVEELPQKEEQIPMPDNEKERKNIVEVEKTCILPPGYLRMR